MTKLNSTFIKLNVGTYAHDMWNELQRCQRSRARRSEPVDITVENPEALIPALTVTLEQLMKDVNE